MRYIILLRSFVCTRGPTEGMSGPGFTWVVDPDWADEFECSLSNRDTTCPVARRRDAALHCVYLHIGAHRLHQRLEGYGSAGRTPRHQSCCGRLPCNTPSPCMRVWRPPPARGSTCRPWFQDQRSRGGAQRHVSSRSTVPLRARLRRPRSALWRASVGREVVLPLSLIHI